MTDPTIVLVPGLWEGPGSFDLLRDELTKANITDIHVAPLRSTGCSSPGNPTMQDDIDGIRAVIEPLVAAGKRIVVVAHSAGGFLSSAATQDLEVKPTTSNTSHGSGGVEKFFYIAAGLLPSGAEHHMPPFCDVQGGKMFCANADRLLWGDVPADVRAKFEPMLQHQPAQGWDGKVSHAAWENVPSMYIITDRDECLPPAWQETFAAMAKSQVEHLPLGHMAQLSGPKQVAEKLIAFIKA